MPIDKLKNSKEAGEAMATTMISFHAELIKAGISKEEALNLVKVMASGGNSNFDGNCGGLSRPGEVVTNPIR